MTNDGFPASDSARKAAEFISAPRKAEPSRSVVSIIDEAGMRFNLSPRETDALHTLLDNSPPPGKDE
jgi:hypothetical protein